MKTKLDFLESSKFVNSQLVMRNCLRKMGWTLKEESCQASSTCLAGFCVCVAGGRVRVFFFPLVILDGDIDCSSFEFMFQLFE